MFFEELVLFLLWDAYLLALKSVFNVMYISRTCFLWGKIILVFGDRWSIGGNKLYLATTQKIGLQADFYSDFGHSQWPKPRILTEDTAKTPCITVLILVFSSDKVNPYSKNTFLFVFMEYRKSKIALPCLESRCARNLRLSWTRIWRTAPSWDLIGRRNGSISKWCNRGIVIDDQW